MKKIFTIALVAIMVLACSTAFHSRRIYDETEISYILANYYPQLSYYYEENVLDIESLREVTLEDNSVSYKIKYHFVRYYYRNYSEKIFELKENFPELYELYISGVIDVNSIYKYVDKSTGKIKKNVSYRNISDIYYNYYLGTYPYDPYYYRRPLLPRRYIVPVPAQPRPQPNDQSREQTDPGQRRDNGNTTTPRSSGSVRQGGSPGSAATRPSGSSATRSSGNTINQNRSSSVQNNARRR